MEEVLIALLDQFWPVADREEEISSMYEIKSFVSKRPWHFDIIDFEAAIRWDPTNSD